MFPVCVLASSYFFVLVHVAIQAQILFPEDVCFFDLGPLPFWTMTTPRQLFFWTFSNSWVGCNHSVWWGCHHKFWICNDTEWWILMFFHTFELFELINIDPWQSQMLYICCCWWALPDQGYWVQPHIVQDSVCSKQVIVSANYFKGSFKMEELIVISLTHVLINQRCILICLHKRHYPLFHFFVWEHKMFDEV